MKAQIRALRARITLWKAGQITELWQRLLDDHKQRNLSQIRSDEKRLKNEAERVARLVDEGLPSRAASQLCSRGLAPKTPETLNKLKQLFPRGVFPLKGNVVDSPSFEVQPEAVRKLILGSPKGPQAVLAYVPNT